MQVNNEQGSLSTAEKTSRLEADLSSLKPFPGNLGCFEVYDVGVNLAVSFSCIVGCPICKIYLVDHGYRNFKEKIHFME